MRIAELLKDSKYVVELLAACPPCDGSQEFAPVRPEWIDRETSEAITDVYHHLIPEDLPYLTYVIVERNPDTEWNGTCVDDNDKRTRYFLLTIVPDTEYPYDLNLPMIVYSSVAALTCWENIRAILAASHEWIRVRVANKPIPPILNNGWIHWGTLYLGRKEFSGVTTMREQWTEGEKPSITLDPHFYNVRRMDDVPVLRELIAAYDETFPADSGTNEGETCREG